MKKIEFTEKNAQKIYDQYMRRVKRSVKSLPLESRTDIIMEINSHIDGAMTASKSTNMELDHILKITEQLGDPEETLKPLVAEKKLEQATRTFNPLHIANAIILNLKNGLIYTIYGILYFAILLGAVILGFKLVSPGRVGLLVGPNPGDWVIGTTTDPTYVDVLGFWFIPLALLTLLGLYVLLTLVMKLTKKKKKR